MHADQCIFIIAILLLLAGILFMIIKKPFGSLPVTRCLNSFRTKYSKLMGLLLAPFWILIGVYFIICLVVSIYGEVLGT